MVLRIILVNNEYPSPNIQIEISKILNMLLENENDRFLGFVAYFIRMYFEI